MIYFFFFCIQISQAALLRAASVSGPFRVWPTRANWPTMTLCPPAKVLHQQQENHRDSNVAPDIFFCFGAEHTQTYRNRHTKTELMVHQQHVRNWMKCCLLLQILIYFQWFSNVSGRGNQLNIQNFKYVSFSLLSRNSRVISLHLGNDLFFHFLHF